MSDLFWPGDERAGRVFEPDEFLATMVEVELVWLRVLHREGLAPAVDDAAVRELVSAGDLEEVAGSAEASGNPVVPLVALMRRRLAERDERAAQWLHRGLTSQDVLDTAVVLSARATTDALRPLVEDQVASLARLADRHRGDLAAGRTLTQHAVPVTFGLTAAQWLRGVLDTRDDLAALRFPVQAGGAAGTLSAVVALTGSVTAARRLTDALARELGLEPADPWHTSRGPLTRYADALVRATDGWGHVANDVLLRARPEVAELAEPAVEGRGGSSTMPQKTNPVLSVLVRRAALVAPGLAAGVHLAAATTECERPAGSWHTEWSALASLSRHTLTAASQTAELLAGLRVDTAEMAARVREQATTLLAERRSLTDLAGEPDADPAHHLGATDEIIEAVLSRAQEVP